MEFLKEVISEETYNALAEQLKDKDIKLVNLSKGEYVSKAKYDTALSDLDTTRTELTQRTNDLTKLSESSNASQELKAEIDKTKAEFEAKEADYQKRLEDNLYDSYVDVQVLQSGTIDAVAAKAHLQTFLSTAERKDGVIVGLDTALSKLKEEKPYLYDKTVATGLKHKDPLKKEPTLQEDIKSKIYR